MLTSGDLESVVNSACSRIRKCYHDVIIDEGAAEYPFVAVTSARERDDVLQTSSRLDPRASQSVH